MCMHVFFNLSTCRVIVAINWKRYHSCTYPLHIWIVVGFPFLILIIPFNITIYFYFFVYDKVAS